MASPAPTKRPIRTSITIEQGGAQAALHHKGYEMTTTSSRPKGQLIKGLKYSVGQAIWVLPPNNIRFDAPVQPIGGVITHIGASRITIQTDAGRRRPEPYEVYHRGCCLTCELGAVLKGDRLICPRCSSSASTTIPEEMQPVWACPFENEWAWCHRRMIAGATWNEACAALDEHKRAAIAPALHQAGLSMAWEQLSQIADRSYRWQYERNLQRYALISIESLIEAFDRCIAHADRAVSRHICSLQSA